MNSKNKFIKPPVNMAVVELPTCFTTSIGSELISLLLAHRGSDLQLNGTNIRKFGAQYLQIILAAQAAWRADKHRFIISPTSDELIAGSELLGASLELFCDAREPTI
ncbi:MAG: hypothetical protein POG74_09630 [Acidocella sp.]|nr:hypothetical protein [Acidocella sp.]